MLWLPLEATSHRTVTDTFRAFAPMPKALPLHQTARPSNQPSTQQQQQQQRIATTTQSHRHSIDQTVVAGREEEEEVGANAGDAVAIAIAIAVSGAQRRWLLLLLPLCGPRTGSASHAPLRCTQATKCLATKLCGPLLRHYPSRRSNNWTLCVRTRTVVALRGCGATHSPPCLLNNTPHSYGYYHPPLSRTLPETSHPARGMYVQVTCEAGLL